MLELSNEWRDTLMELMMKCLSLLVGGAIATYLWFTYFSKQLNRDLDTIREISAKLDAHIKHTSSNEFLLNNRIDNLKARVLWSEEHISDLQEKTKTRWERMRDVATIYGNGSKIEFVDELD